jgi:rubredoxin
MAKRKQKLKIKATVCPKCKSNKNMVKSTYCTKDHYVTGYLCRKCDVQKYEFIDLAKLRSKIEI